MEKIKAKRVDIESGRMDQDEFLEQVTSAYVDAEKR